MHAYTVHLTRTALFHFAHTLVRTAMLLYHIQCVGLTPLQLVLVGGPPLGALGAHRLPLAFLASAAVLSPALWLLRCPERAQPGETTRVPRISW